VVRGAENADVRISRRFTSPAAQVAEIH